MTVSYFEWVQDENHLFWDEQDVNGKLEKVMTRAFSDVLKIHLERKVEHAAGGQHAWCEPRGGSGPGTRTVSVRSKANQLGLPGNGIRHSRAGGSRPLTSLGPLRAMNTASQ